MVAGALYNGDDTERLSEFVSKIEKATGHALPVVDSEELSAYKGSYIFLDDTNSDFSSYEIKVEKGNIILYANYYSLDDCISAFLTDMLHYDANSDTMMVNIAEGKRYTVRKSAVYTKEKLMSVLEEIYNDDSRLIIGQQMYQATPIGELFDRETNAFVEGCGVEAAMYGWDCVGSMIYPQNQRNIESGRVKLVYQMIEYMRDGGIITLSTHFPNPTEENPLPGNSIKNPMLNGDADWQDLFTEGTDTYNRYWAYVEQLGDFLQIFKDNGAPVIFRPFFEYNGNWTWYRMIYKDEDGNSHRFPPEYMKELWISLYDYLVNERGIDNLIWVYSPNVTKRAEPEAYWVCTVMYAYPGDEYVDIVGVDWYPGAEDQANPVELIYAYEDLTLPTGKIFAYGELSAGDNRTVGDNYTFTAKDYGDMLKKFAAKGIKSAYVLAWSSYDSDEGRHKIGLYDMGDGKEFFVNNPGFLDKEATKKLLYS